MKRALSLALLAIALMGGCNQAGYRPPPPNPQADAQADAQAAAAFEQARQIMAQNSAQQAAVWSQVVQHAPRIDIPPGGYQTSNGYPNNQSRIPPQNPIGNGYPSIGSVDSSPQMPSGIGAYPTGATKTGMDGTTWYEMRDVNGSTFWTNKRPF